VTLVGPIAYFTRASEKCSFQEEVTSDYPIGLPRGKSNVTFSRRFPDGALQVSCSDGHDPYAVRGKRTLTASLLCALAVVAGGFVGRNLILAIFVPARERLLRDSLVNEETDRITNSLNTLREQIVQWNRFPG
jgi:hypothetical protein